MGETATNIEPDYRLFENQLDTIKTMLRVCNESVAIIDYYKNNYAFISAKEMMYCGYAEEEIMAMGKDFTKHIIYKEDKNFINKVQKEFCELVSNLPVERKDKLTVYLNHRFAHKSGEILSIDMRITPFLFHENGDLWMTFACLSFSTKTQKVGAYMEMNDTQERFEFSFAKQRLVAIEVKPLSEKERRILLLNSRGYTEIEIAAELNISINTVKFHKRNVFEKTHSKTLTESFVYASSHRLL